MKVQRQHEITRIEGFSDAVFAFALTLLVVSLEVPHSYHELMVLVRGFLPFACSFALLVWIWYEQTAFFRSYHLQDRLTVVLNAALLFTVLFYVYPLKYVFTLAFSIPIPALRQPGAPETMGQMVRIFVVYGVGFVAVFGVFALMYFHAWRRRDDIGLTPLEAGEALGGVGTHLTSVAVWASSRSRGSLSCRIVSVRTRDSSFSSWAPRIGDTGGGTPSASGHSRRFANPFQEESESVWRPAGFVGDVRVRRPPERCPTRRH